MYYTQNLQEDIIYTMPDCVKSFAVLRQLLISNDDESRHHAHCALLITICPVYIYMYIYVNRTILHPGIFLKSTGLVPEKRDRISQNTM